MQIDFSPLSVFNTVTNYSPLTMEKRNLKSETEKKIIFRGQFKHGDSIFPRRQFGLWTGVPNAGLE